MRSEAAEARVDNVVQLPMRAHIKRQLPMVVRLIPYLILSLFSGMLVAGITHRNHEAVCTHRR